MLSSQVFFFFWPHHGMRQFLRQRSDPHHCCSLHHKCCNIRSLSLCISRELPFLNFFFFKSPKAFLSCLLGIDLCTQCSVKYYSGEYWEYCGFSYFSTMISLRPKRKLWRKKNSSNNNNSNISKVSIGIKLFNEKDW